MDIPSTFNFKRSRESLSALENLLKCEKCNGYYNNPLKHGDCGFIFCACQKYKICPGCGKKLTITNTISALNINSIIDITKSIKTLICKESLKITEHEDSMKTSHNIPNSNTKVKSSSYDTNATKSDSTILKVPVEFHKNENARGNMKALPHSRNTATDATSILIQSNTRQNSKETSSSKKERYCVLRTMSADVKAIMKRNAKGETKLHSACVKGDVKRVEEYLNMGADPCTKDNAGWTPLHEAVSKGHMPIIKLLLQAGSLVNVPGGYNNTPLHDAALTNYLEAAKLLIDFGANPHLRNIEGNTPLSMAQSEEMEIILKSFCPSKALCRNTDHYCYRHEVMLYGLNLSGHEVKRLEYFAQHFNIKLSTSFNSNVSHIIVNSLEKRCKISLHFLQGILKGSWIIDYTWLQSCLNADSFEDPSDHEIIGTTRFPDSFAPRKSRENREKMQPSIFNGCHFYFANVDKTTVEDVTFTKQILTSLIVEGNGIVLSREPNPEAIPAHECTVPFHATSGMLEKCSHYILYQPGRHEPILKYKMSHVKSLPISWLLSCIESFSLIEPL